MAWIECRDVRLGYDGVTVCEHLNCSVRQGDYFCIVGSNGSGKTTLMKTLLHQKKPESGEIRFADGFSAREIGYLPQQSEIKRDFPATVREVVLSGCVGKKDFAFFPGRRARAKAEETMKRLEISDLSESSVSALSGGQRQRVLLARALCAAESLLLLDEPVSGLDPQGTEELYETVARLHREGVTVLMITHDLAAVARYATAVLKMGENPVFYPDAREYVRSLRLGEEEESAT